MKTLQETHFKEKETIMKDEIFSHVEFYQEIISGDGAQLQIKFIF